MLYLIKLILKISKILRESLNIFLLKTNIYYILISYIRLNKSNNLYNNSKLIKVKPF
jgi:hypothetical protein